MSVEKSVIVKVDLDTTDAKAKLEELTAEANKLAETLKDIDPILRQLPR